MAELPESIHRTSHRVFPYVEASDVVVWSFDDVLAVLDRLVEHRIGVVGGDVYRLVGSKWVHDYAPWSVEQDDLATFERLLERGVLRARRFISSYPRSDEAYFELTLADENDWRGVRDKQRLD